MAVTIPIRSGRAAQRPELFLKMAERMPPHDVALAQMVQKCAQAYQEVVDFRARLDKDETRTEGARLVAVAKAARSKVLPVLEALEQSKMKVQERADGMRAQLAEIYNPKNKTYETCMRHAEIRALFRAMPRGDAIKALEAARQANDEDTLIALVSYQPYLSGIPNELHQHARDHLVEAKMPDHMAALKNLAEQTELAAGFRSEVLQSLADLIPFEKADAIVEAAQADVAAA